MTYSNSILIICLTSILMGYLFGSLMWSIIIGKIFFKKDPRDFESKNPGATNSSRIFGKKIALIVLILDVLKAIIPMISCWLIAKYALNISQYITYSFNPFTLVYLSGFFAVLGHFWPIFFEFKGGKGVATFGGFLISAAPFVALTNLLFFILIVLIFKYVSLSSLIGTLLSCFLIFIPGLNYSFILGNSINDLFLLNCGSIYWLLVIWAMLVILTIFIWIKHKNNIVLLIKKQERKFRLKNDSIKTRK